MTIYIGSDHNGFRLKAHISDYLKKRSVTVIDVGDERLDPHDDFPVFASAAVHAMQSSSDSNARAILIAANRFKGVRAGLGWSVEAAKGIRNDEDSNVLALPSELLEKNSQLAHDIIDAWLDTPFAAAARYIRRNNELDQLV
jgi:ribose 5-phosphate isomerase B